MKLFVFGFNHLKGTSKKSGNDYDFYQVETLSKRNQGVGCVLMGNVMAVQAPAFENILQDFLGEDSVYPVLLSAEFDNRGALVEVDFLADGDEAQAQLVDFLNK